jgi:hypothetical protein
MMRSSCRGLILLALACSGLFGCAKSPTQPDSVVGLSIRSAQQIPLDGDGADSSGNEPRPAFRWKEVLTASGGGRATVRASRTELRESSSETVVAFSGFAPGTSVEPGATLELPVVVASVPGALRQGHWEGRASVDIAHASGRVETLQVAFSFE